LAFSRAYRAIFGTCAGHRQPEHPENGASRTGRRSFGGDPSGAENRQWHPQGGDACAGKKGRCDVQLEVIPFSVNHSSERWMLIIFESRSRRCRRFCAARRGVRMPRAATRAKSPGCGPNWRPRKIRCRRSSRSRRRPTKKRIKSANERLNPATRNCKARTRNSETAKEELQSTNEEAHHGQRRAEQPEPGDKRDQQRPEQLVEQHSHRHRDGGQCADHPPHHPAGRKTFQYHPGDIGRKLSDINPNLDIPGCPP